MKLPAHVSHQLKLAGFTPSAQSLKQFQAAFGLPPTGVVDAKTQAHLDQVQQRVKAHGKDGFASVGQKSEHLKTDEKRLRALGYDVGQVDGVFDRKTASAVKAYRADQWQLKEASFTSRRFDRTLAKSVELISHQPYHQRLKPTQGHRRLDARTAAQAAKAGPDGTVGLGPGSDRKTVANVQAHLHAAGFNPMHTGGVYDERTAGMVKQFQHRVGLPATGTVDPATWASLKKAFLYAKTGTSVPQAEGERSKAVAATEKQLKQLGYHVKADGIFGKDTGRAVRAFQHKHHLNVSGAVGGATQKALATAVKNQVPHSSSPFINAVAKGAVEAMRKFGVPASVTIAQAILESGWGKSGLSRSAHNLFGIKGRGPAGSVTYLTREVYNGQSVMVHAAFRKYHNDAESIADHAKLLATSGYYTRAMSHRHDPKAFANALTGVYATDPHYGASLISLIKAWHLTRYDRVA